LSKFSFSNSDRELSRVCIGKAKIKVKIIKKELLELFFSEKRHLAYLNLSQKRISVETKDISAPRN